MPASARSVAPHEDDAPARVAAWTRGYAPLPGIPDEFIGPDGTRRPHWQRLLHALAALEPSEIAQRFAASDRRIRNRGMSYRVQGETSERVWPLSRVPLVIPEAEWREIAKGVAQRAELLERVLADVYGEGRLVAEGVLPDGYATENGTGLVFFGTELQDAFTEAEGKLAYSLTRDGTTTREVALETRSL